MAEALGLRPKTERAHHGRALEKHEMDELLKRGRTDEDRDDNDKEASRIKGRVVRSDIREGRAARGRGGKGVCSRWHANTHTYEDAHRTRCAYRFFLFFDGDGSR